MAESVAAVQRLDVSQKSGEVEQDSEHGTLVDGEQHASSPLDTAREPEAQSQPAATGPKSQPGATWPAWALLLLGGTAAGALLLWRSLRRRGSGGKLQPVQVPKDKVFEVFLSLGQAPPAQPLAPSPPLAGRVLVVSDRLDVEGVQTRFGSDAWQAGRQPSGASHAVLGMLLGAGVQARAVVAAECMGLGPLLGSGADALPNPVCQGRSNGGGDYGAAVAIAAGHADLALAVDELGSVRVPAACCGVYAFRPTAGVLPLEGASTASHSLAAPALLAREPHLLLKAGEALRLPGGGSRGEVATYLVAEDYFSQCSPRCRAAVPAVIAAVKRWAGPDQAQGLSLCEWLFHRLHRLREWIEEEQAGPAKRDANGGRQRGLQQGRRGPSVLHALASVAETIRQWEFGQKYGQWVAQQEKGALPLEAVRFQEQAVQVSEERYRSAQAVMADLNESMRAALQEGFIFVLPTLPGEAPTSGGGGSDAAAATEEFRQQALQFTALAALAGVPQVTLPLPLPGQLPLSVSLICLHKKDLSLLQAAAKLGPLLAEEAAKLAQQQAVPQRGSAGAGSRATAGRGAATGAAAAAAAAAPAGAREGRGAPGGSSGASRKKEAAAADVEAERRARAEACKEEGNASFRGRKYEEAIRHYSAAVQMDPKNPVYYNNRAQAYLKLGLYSQAEEDCDAALDLELNVKALLRRGSARVARGDAEGAKADFRQALALEPQNKQARQELLAIEQMEAAIQPGGY